MKDWDDFLSSIKKSKVSHQDFITWFNPLEATITLGDDVKVRVVAPNSLIVAHIKEHFLPLIQKYFEDKYHLPVKIAFRVGDSIRHTQQKAPEMAKSVPSHHKPSTLSISLVPINPAYTFENFVEGESNSLAIMSAQKLAKNALSHKGGGVLLLYGQSGLGKTHLLHAIALELNRDKSIKYALITTEMFYRQMVQAIKSDTIEDFKEYFRSLDVLLMDDVQFFAGKTHSQEEVLYIYDRLIDKSKSVILTCDKYPKDVEIDKKHKLDDRLRTRFCAGLSISIEPPKFETRVQILMQKASLSGYELAREPAEVIAAAVKSNVRELEGALKMVAINAEIKKVKIDERVARETLRDLMEIGEKQISLENIVRNICEYFNVSSHDLLSASRLKHLVYARQIGMYVAKEMTDKSLSDIGKYFGGRGHATVLHSIAKIKELQEREMKVAGDLKALSRRIYS